MITFPFTVRKSFLGSSHPITVPSRLYKGLENLKAGVDGVSISTDYVPLRGIIYHGNAGWGPYFQIRKRGRNYILPDDAFTVGQRILVTIERKINEVFVTLRRAQ
jgi:hypothetical protein